MISSWQPRLIVSLTSFPARIPHIAPCLQSLVGQTGKPDRIILWLGETQFPRGLDDVPPQIRAFSTTCGGGIEFRFTNDMRAYTKLVPALLAFPDDVIVTVDDDTIYDPSMVRLLKMAYRSAPNTIHAHAISDVYRSHGEWKRTSGTVGFGKIACNTKLRMMLGLGGVLYPPRSLHDMATDSARFIKLSPTNDDIWFWISAVRQGTTIALVPSALSRQTGIPSATSTGALSAINEVDGDRKNMEQLCNILEAYPDIEAELSKDFRQKAATIGWLRLRRFCLHYPRQIVYCLRQGGLRFMKAEIRRYCGGR